MGLSIDGLSSGLDTTALINSLMAVEAIPQGLMKNKAATVQTRISALQGLNTAVADLATKAGKLSDPKSLELYSASSSSAKVTTVVGAGAKPGAVDFTVSQLAQTQVSVSKNLAAWPYTTMTVTGEGGQAITVTPLTSSLDDVVSAVNLSGAGIVASKVSVGGGEYRLQFASSKTGVAGGFSIADPDGTAGLTKVQSGQDAQIKLWAGTAAEATLSSATNTFADVLSGVSISVSEVSATPTRVTVARDDAQIGRAASDLVSSVNGVLAQIATKSAVVSSTDASGNPVTSGGVFTGDSTVRTVNAAILAAASQPLNGKSPSELGIGVTKTGTMEFDATKFGDALAKDPAGTMAAVATIAGRVADAAKQASDPSTGLLSTKIKGQQSTAKDYTDQIADWDDRLEMRRTTLQRTYSALEVALSGMKAQSSWLSSQLAGLSSGSSSS
ncbi:flagellar filament capping protein FliD [Arthrobacter sp. NicSoilC12]|uniref:flagellar filament capping protein FliD n=1 Tax=Arthrobacter sp. NicSoilC12 TaxID=2831001 RepID=UPI001CC75E46|nr:flagellar filament capping protein FliD [Arthrobacter sp. NicSoilC12]GIU55509.1 flagellar hook-associated protein 2 [Arthrobacter sp. NicSoilC12]